MSAVETRSWQVRSLTTWPRVTGAGIGTLVGALVVASGTVVGALFDGLGMPWAASSASGFVGFGIVVTVAAVLAGWLVGPMPFGHRNGTVVASLAFTLISIVGCSAITLALSIATGATMGDASPAKVVLVLALYAVGTSIVAGAIWISLIRAVASVQLRRGVPTLVICCAAMAVTVLVESLVLGLPALGLT
jgi:fumarate reductase subunit C